LRFILIFIFIFAISINASAQKIATFKFSFILNNLELYKEFISNLEEFKKKNFTELKKKEEYLLTKKNKIEESKIILSEKEYLNRISEFNNERNIFETEVNKLNNYLKSIVEINQDIILKEVAKIIEQVARENKINLILTDDQYYLSSEDLDISEIILIKLNQIDLKLQLTNYNYL